jgi:hypothetical protein
MTIQPRITKSIMIQHKALLEDQLLVVVAMEGEVAGTITGEIGQ